MTVNYEKIITLTGVAKEAVGFLHTYQVQSDDEILVKPEKLGIVSPDLAARMSDLAKFRNVIMPKASRLCEK